MHAPDARRNHIVMHDPDARRNHIVMHDPDARRKHNVMHDPDARRNHNVMHDPDARRNHNVMHDPDARRNHNVGRGEAFAHTGRVITRIVARECFAPTALHHGRHRWTWRHRVTDGGDGRAASHLERRHRVTDGGDERGFTHKRRRSRGRRFRHTARRSQGPPIPPPHAPRRRAGQTTRRECRPRPATPRRSSMAPQPPAVPRW
jgi:hypothetical protein